MNLIRPYVEIIPQDTGLKGIDKIIEVAGRTCYKSESKITHDSCRDFVDRIIDKGHHSVLEHGTVYLYLPPGSPINFHKYRDDKYSAYREVRAGEKPYPKVHSYVTTNYRRIIEEGWIGDIDYLCEPTKHHDKRLTVRFVLSRDIAQEFTRHRVFSFTMESQRYCNYSQDRFDNELTFIIPSQVNPEEFPKTCIINHDKYGSLISEYYFHLTGKGSELFRPQEVTAENNFIAALQVAEQLYMELLKQGWSPQQARAVLPNATKTELVMTGFISQWMHFLSLRSPLAGASGVHPDAAYLADALYQKLKEKRII